MNNKRKTRLYFPRPHSLLTVPLTPRKLARGFLGALLCCAPLIASAQIRVEAESAFTNVGMQFETTTDSGGGQKLGEGVVVVLCYEIKLITKVLKIIVYGRGGQ